MATAAALSGRGYMAARNKRKGRKPALEIVAPTPEQQRDGRFEVVDVTDKSRGGGTITIGKSYRRVPMISTLHDQGVFTAAEYKALKHYRHHADIADRSPTRDSLANAACPIRGSGGDGPTRTMLNAAAVVEACERAAGSLVDILRAVVVEDMSLSQWAISRSGSIEDCRTEKGQRVCRLKPKQKALAIAKLEIQVVAQRVQSELDA